MNRNKLLVESFGLPVNLIDNLTCTFIEDNCVGHVIAATKSGYLIEFKNGKILSSCLTGVKDTCQIRPFYMFHDEISLHYILLGLLNTFVIVSKVNDRFEVVVSMDAVEKFEIFDFENTGEPQVAIWTRGNPNKEIVFPQNETENTVDVDNSDNPSALAALFNTIQQAKLQLNQLYEDLHVKQTFLRKYLEQGCQIDIDSVLVCGDNMEVVKGNVPCLISVTDPWQRIYGSYWILGMSLINHSESLITGLNVTSKNQRLYACCYRVFNFDNDIWLSRSCRSLIPNGTTFLIVWTEIIRQKDDYDLLNSLTLTIEYAEGIACDTPNFTLLPEEIISGQLELFSNQYTNADLLSLICVNSAAFLKVKIPFWTGTSLEDIFEKKYNMTRLSRLGKEYFYRDAGSFHGLFFHSSTVTIQPTYEVVLRILAKNSAQLISCIKSLYSLLPLGTCIEPLETERRQVQDVPDQGSSSSDGQRRMT